MTPTTSTTMYTPGPAPSPPHGRTKEERDFNTKMSKLHSEYRAYALQNNHSLDLLQLPIETRFEYYHLMPGTSDTLKAVPISHDRYRYYGVHSSIGGLEPSNFGVAGHLNFEKSGIEAPRTGLGANVIDREEGKAKQIGIMPDGSSSIAILGSAELWSLVAQGKTTPELATKRFVETVVDGLASLFIGSDTLRFPPAFKRGREGVSFMGLPSGTTFKTANGGQFEVLRRANVDLDYNNRMDGHLYLYCKNSEALTAAKKAGWAFDPVYNENCLASSNLFIRSARYRVLTDTIKCPFISPLDLLSKHMRPFVWVKFHTDPAFNPSASEEDMSDLEKALAGFM